jgi:5-methylcytosine-specific restriction endonuclease McrA
MQKCVYGCGQDSMFLNSAGNPSCSKHSSQCPEVRRKNSEKLKIAHAQGKMPVDPFGKSRAWNTGNVKADFSYGGKGKHKVVLILERGHKCQRCNNTKWLDAEITLELEHIDGDNQNNEKDNLLLLCPNCHSQTKTWKSSSKNKGVKSGRRVSDEELLNAILETNNFSEALRKVGLTDKGYVYVRCYKLAVESEKWLEKKKS